MTATIELTSEQIADGFVLLRRIDGASRFQITAGYETYYSENGHIALPEGNVKAALQCGDYETVIPSQDAVYEAHAIIEVRERAAAIADKKTRLEQSVSNLKYWESRVIQINQKIEAGLNKEELAEAIEDLEGVTEMVEDGKREHKERLEALQLAEGGE